MFNFTKFLKKPTVIHMMPKGGLSVTGITVLGSNLFVVRDTSQVHVYNYSNHTLTYTWTITGSEQLVGIVSCSLLNCLYASDIEQKVIYKVDPLKMVLNKWSVNGTCYGLSVTKRHTVLATLFDTKRIQEYSTIGQLIRVIKLDNSVVRPWHCVQLSTGDYVVNHAGSGHRICIVDTSGHVIQSYGRLQGCASWGQLNYPVQLAVDKYDNVLVADSDNNRVQVLSPTLTYLGDIAIPKYQLNYPYALHIDELNQRLCIGEYRRGGRLFVLDGNTEQVTVI